MSAQARRRLFFALDFDDEATRSAIAALQARLGFAGRPVPPENFHATLVFLGLVPETQIEELLELGGSLHPPHVTVPLDRLGCFPRAAALWLGSSEVPPELTRFQANLAKALRRTGRDFDQRRWQLHVTLYRGLRKRPDTMDLTRLEWDCRSYSLMESRTVEGGVRYRAIQRWKARM